MIIQQPKQLKDSLRWRMVETSDEDESHFIELCPCTLGHSYEYQAVQCAKIHERLANPKHPERPKCYECKYFKHGLESTRFTANTNEVKGVFHGVLFREWCERSELQSEADIGNEQYAERMDADTICADEDYSYFEGRDL